MAARKALGVLGVVASLLGTAAPAVGGEAPEKVAALEARLATAPASERLGVLNELGALLVRRDPQRALALGREAATLAASGEDLAGEARARRTIGLSLMVLERSADGLPEMQRARELFARVPDRAEEARTLGYCGMLLSELGRLWPAVEAAREALAAFRELSDAKGQAAAQNNLGVLFCALGDYQKALEHNLEALRLEEGLGRKIGVANNLNGIGNVYSQLREHLKARSYFERALPLFEELGEKAGAAKVLNNIGNTYEKAGEDERALEYLERALAVGQAEGIRTIEADALTNIAVVMKKRGRYEEALRRDLRVAAIREETGARADLAGTYHNVAEIRLLQGRPDDALAYLGKALAIGQEDRSNETLASVHRLMAQCYEAKGDFRRAYGSEVLASEAREAMLDGERSRKVAELQEKYEADARARQIDLLRKDNELLKKDGEIRRLALTRTRLLAGLLLAVAALAVASILLFFRRFRYLATFWRKRSYVGRYRIVETIASGGMGVVYRAEDVSQGGRPFALKVIREELSSDPEVRARFVNEAALVDQLHHPNVVRIFERGEHDGRLFMAMELLAGPSLAELIRKGEDVPLALCVDVAAQLADALAKIHSKGIVHRDVKPENVVLAEAGDGPAVVKLLDFGLATTRSLTRLTQTGLILGTVSYLSPEQITDRSVTPASDLYSLGAVLYELLTLRKPFPGETPVDVIRQILDREPVPPARFREEVPAPLDALVLELLSKDPARRPDDESLVARLAQLRIGLTVC